ncbi:hypothetical protein ASPWEDRAFT_100481 [Aspergillus wentii DTO 134E9]|uniref:Glutamyl-tRNA synthetase n=1 Tax=Aspergillus wentii DTO 134E9 TaxID=1073089 RepID=A0A1L9S058_ASPWE|nr:uncharacterized protein ASPWEDRAFT_100481 [Aspergillus wentii DTO 134E9]KAI9932895.1 hypothetical protein MW887_009147 [Aspergillus wentii]OJJ40478.1 hypothetical protein ASPWEDRAFT_100481 [Aspergillus wentii DTO 134E9]
MTKFETALRLIDEAHAQDPTITTINNTPIPYELHYAQKMTKYLQKRSPDASETLQLAVRAQHLKRWEVPRSSYPAGKVGYYSWRGYLARRQAELVEQMCVESGYSASEAGRVGALVRKEDLKKGEEETQVLEDVACLVFLDDQFEEFERGYEEEKVIGILQKTWAKMSEKGHELALGIEMSERAKGLVGKALS